MGLPFEEALAFLALVDELKGGGRLLGNAALHHITLRSDKQSRPVLLRLDRHILGY